MTEKQQKIIASALELFAEQGYNAVSTNKIAKDAGVSEGLIFRHFESKKGLLDAIMQEGKARIIGQIKQLDTEEDAKMVIYKAISLPFDVDEGQYHFWRLYYSLKWQTVQYDFSILEPLHESLQNAFEDLQYENPKAEAEIVSMLIDGLATAILLRNPGQKELLRQTILQKYNL